MNNPDVPESAERIDYLPWLQTAKRPSKFVPGLDALIPVFVCPACKSRQPPIRQCANFTCDCGLSMRPDGGDLYIWRERPRDGAPQQTQAERERA